MCDLHYRIEGMVRGSFARKKAPPNRKTLEEMILGLDEMKCPACGITMQLHTEYNGRPCVASVQHWDSGEIGILCFSCNSRHCYLGDEKFSRITTESKTCCHCKEIFPIENFHKGGPGYKNTSGKCKTCANAYNAEYRKKKKSQVKVSRPS